MQTGYLPNNTFKYPFLHQIREVKENLSFQFITSKMAILTHETRFRVAPNGIHLELNSRILLILLLVLNQPLGWIFWVHFPPLLLTKGPSSCSCPTVWGFPPSHWPQTSQPRSPAKAEHHPLPPPSRDMLLLGGLQWHSVIPAAQEGVVWRGWGWGRGQVEGAWQESEGALPSLPPAYPQSWWRLLKTGR